MAGCLAQDQRWLRWVEGGCVRAKSRNAIMKSMTDKRLADGTLVVSDACGAVFALQIWRNQPNFQIVCPMCGNGDGRGMQISRVPSELYEVEALHRIGAYEPSDTERECWSRIRERLNTTPEALE